MKIRRTWEIVILPLNKQQKFSQSHFEPKNHHMISKEMTNQQLKERKKEDDERWCEFEIFLSSHTPTQNHNQKNQSQSKNQSTNQSTN